MEKILEMEVDSGVIYGTTISDTLETIQSEWAIAACIKGEKHPNTKGYHHMSARELASHFPRVDHLNKGKKYRCAITGKASGIIVLDIDSKDDGLIHLEELKAKLGLEEDMGSNYIQTTKSEGLHFFYKWTEKVAHLKTSAKFGEKPFDIRAQKGVIMIAPTKGYHWKKSAGEMLEMPDCLLEWLTENAPSGGKRKREDTDESKKEPKLLTKETPATPKEEKPKTNKKRMIDYFDMPEMLPVLIEILMGYARLITVEDEYYPWLHMGCAICNTVGEKGYSVFQYISKKGAKYNEQECRKKWMEICTSEGEHVYGLAYLHELASKPTNISEIRNPYTEHKYSRITPMWGVFRTLDRENDKLMYKNLLCAIQQQLRNTLVFIGKHSALTREHHWENNEPFFNMSAQRGFLEHCAIFKTADKQTSLRDIVTDLYAEIAWAQLCFYPTNFKGEGIANIYTNGRNAFNMFLGFRVWKKMVDKTEYTDFSKVETILKHIKEVFFWNDDQPELQEEGSKWFVKYLGCMFCRPWARTDKMPILISKVGGVGKSAFFLWFIDQILGSLYGEEITSQHQMDPRFNAREQFLILKFFDDIETKNTKAMCTRKYIKVEHKGIDHVDMGTPDFSNLVKADNSYKPSKDSGNLRRDVVLDCNIKYAAGTPMGDRYLNELFSAFECPTTAADFALYITREWEKDPVWEKKYSPPTALGTKTQEAAANCDAADTLQHYAETYANDDLPKTGIPKACLWALHCHLMASKRQSPGDKNAFLEKIEEILAKNCNPSERAQSRFRHNPMLDAGYNICGCKAKKSEKGAPHVSGYRHLTLNGLCGALRKWFGHSRHLEDCSCMDKTMAAVLKNMRRCGCGLTQCGSECQPTCI